MPYCLSIVERLSLFRERLFKEVQLESFDILATKISGNIRPLELTSLIQKCLDVQYETDNADTRFSLIVKVLYMHDVSCSH